jgi:LmbE family N-acetylglucosaminyl deacetylase
MPRALTLLAFLALIACGGDGAEDDGAPGGAGGGGDAGEGGSEGGGGGAGATETVVWIGAHPDDEFYAAPWLAELCLERGGSCKLVVLTRGEAGKCKLPAGCMPDLATVRDAELVASAALFGAELVHWDLGDGTSPSVDGVAEQWSSLAGGPQALVDQVAAELAAADRVVTLDPRHGDSCHPDHRVAGALGITAATQAGVSPDRIHLVTSRLVLEPAVPGDEAVWAYDASTVLAATGEPAWATLIDVLQTHQSQFTPDEVAQVAAVEPAMQRTWLVDGSDFVADDPQYAGLCP